MNIKKIIEDIRDFLSTLSKGEKEVREYRRHSEPHAFFDSQDIHVELDSCKEIILQDETQLELGGVNKTSFSLIYPLHLPDFIKNGKITLIGPEIPDLADDSINFGLFMLIGFGQISEKDFDDLKHFSFVSNGIEGSMIRTIPRRFWCRISNDVADRFSFEFLGNAIFHLYEEKFGKLIHAMELIFISSHADLVEKFEALTSEIRDHLDKRWRDKIEEWKKRIDCDYDWECNVCPYFDACDDVREVLEEREKIS